MRLYVLFAFLVFSVIPAVGQTPQVTPPPQPRPTPASTPQQVSVPIRPRQSISRIPNPFSLNPVSESDRLAARVIAVQRIVAPLYRKPSGKELDAIAPRPEFESQYVDLLRQPKTGIFRLVPDAGCAANVKVVNAREECLKYSMPGAGNSYSFRTGNYRIRHLADITHGGDELLLTGIFMHAIVTDLGDVPLEGVSTATPGMNFLVEFKPSTTADDVGIVDSSILNGVEVNGFRYAKSVALKEGTTYAYRGVAYRGRVVRSAYGIRYNELDYDDREDVLVAFRVVERGGDGSVTIVWRQLSELDSPKIKIPDQKDTENSADGGN